MSADTTARVMRETLPVIEATVAGHSLNGRQCTCGSSTPTAKTFERHLAIHIHRALDEHETAAARDVWSELDTTHRMALGTMVARTLLELTRTPARWLPGALRRCTSGDRVIVQFEIAIDEMNPQATQIIENLNAIANRGRK